MKNMLMDNVCAEMDTISLDILVEFALLLKFMMLPIESVTLLVRPMKFGILSSEHADAYLPIT